MSTKQLCDGCQGELRQGHHAYGVQCLWNEPSRMARLDFCSARCLHQWAEAEHEAGR